jgi:pimeloyl-ACP methyl ester carboxylesterase
MGAGIHEQDDILGAIDWLLDEEGVAPGSIGLMGVSYGASILLLTAAQAPEVGAVLADSAFAELTDLIVSEVADRTPIPEPLAGLLRPGVVLAARISRGVDVGAVVPADAIASLSYPVAIVHCRGDERITLDHGQRVFAAAPPGSTMAVIDGCEHAKASDIEGDAYVERAVAYFRERFAAP